MDDRLVLTKESNYRAIADALRMQLDCSDSFAPGEMAAAVGGIPLGLPPPEPRWERPADWPDLDSLGVVRGDDGPEVCYYTFDNRKTVCPAWQCWIGLAYRMAPGGSILLERGTVANGVFTATSSVQGATTTSATGSKYLHDYYGSDSASYVVYRVTPQGGKHITMLQFYTLADSVTGSSSTLYAMQMPCLERLGNLPWLVTYACSSYQATSITTNCTMWTQHDALRPGKITSLLYAYSQCFSLRRIECGDWDVSENRQLSYTWNNCYKLQELDIAGWDTSAWGLTNISYAWNGCWCLRRLDLSKWDTSDWAVTNAGSTWYNCRSLRTLGVSTWDTSGWKVSGMANCWSACWSLLELDLSKWDVSGWKLTAMTNVWGACYSLRRLDVSTWDVSKWPVASLSSTFNGLYSLVELDLSGWDMSEWPITSVDMAFRYMYVARKIKLGDLPMGNLTATNGSRQPLSDCYSVEELSGLSGWVYDISLAAASNLTVASMRGIFQNLGTGTGKTITLHANAYARLSAADLAIATNKGWTVAVP